MKQEQKTSVDKIVEKYRKRIRTAIKNGEFGDDVSAFPSRLYEWIREVNTRLTRYQLITHDCDVIVEDLKEGGWCRIGWFVKYPCKYVRMNGSSVPVDNMESPKRNSVHDDYLIINGDVWTYRENGRVVYYDIFDQSIINKK